MVSVLDSAAQHFTDVQPLWTQTQQLFSGILFCLFQTFKLLPGIHTISLRQEEYGFRLSKLALVPVQISKWADLGMQSRHIPDGFLSAFPYSSNPEPRYGRLHANGLSLRFFQ